MNSYRRNVPLLAFAQAMAMSGASMTVATAALVGLALAEDKSLSTLPLAMQFIAVMLTSIPAAMLMDRIGRKAGFLFSTLFAVGGAVVSSWAIVQGSFVLFVMGTALIGVFNGFANYFRFAAADAVDEQYKSRAISLVLAGGVVAALLGPNLANYTQFLVKNAAFAGSYAALIVLYLLAIVAMALLQLPQHKELSDEQREQRPLRQIIAQPRWLVAVISGMLGYGVMSFVMTATPLAMKHHAHAFSDTSFVIQWHVLAMFAPSFVTGSIINKAGEIKVMFVGALLGFACVFINLNGTSVTHFWVALFLLGVSWNFLYVGATSLLTQTYHVVERFKVQALNDFIIFTTVAFASLSAGYLQHHYGWRAVNIGVLPLLGIVVLSIVYLLLISRRQPLVECRE